MWKILICIASLASLFLFNSFSQSTYAEGEKSQSAGESVEESAKYEYYFDFTPESYILPASGEIAVKFLYNAVNLDGKKWRVKPFAENATIMIRGSENNAWVFSTSSWNDLPSLDEEIRLKIISGSDIVLLEFQLKDLDTGEKYDTPAKILWTGLAYEDYYKAINRNLIDWRVAELVVKETSGINPPKNKAELSIKAQTQSLAKLTDNSNWIFANLGAFFISAMAGFSRKGDKMASWKDSLDMYLRD